MRICIIDMSTIVCIIFIASVLVIVVVGEGVHWSVGGCLLLAEGKAEEILALVVELEAVKGTRVDYEFTFFSVFHILSLRIIIIDNAVSQCLRCFLINLS